MSPDCDSLQYLRTLMLQKGSLHISNTIVVHDTTCHGPEGPMRKLVFIISINTYHLLNCTAKLPLKDSQTKNPLVSKQTKNVKTRPRLDLD